MNVLTTQLASHRQQTGILMVIIVHAPSKFSLNIFTEFSKCNVQKVLCFKIFGTCPPLCIRPRSYQSTSEILVADKIFKFSPIHASVIFHIPWIRLIHWVSDPFREVPIDLVRLAELSTFRENSNNYWLHVRKSEWTHVDGVFKCIYLIIGIF